MKTGNDPIIINKSKIKIVWCLIISALFVVAGLFFVLRPEIFSQNTFVIVTVGLSSIALFGLCLMACIWMLSFSKSAIVIDDEGLTISGGFGHSKSERILWADIADISRVEIESTPMIAIVLKDNQAYIDSRANAVSRKLAAWNLSLTGAPISISSNTYKISFDELWALVISSFITSRA